MAQAKYEEWVSADNLTLLAAWSRDGLSMQVIAKKIGISRKTLYVWKDEHSDISDALKRGKEIVDTEVENTALKCCHGYTVTVKKTFKCKRIEYDATTGKKTLEAEELKEGFDEVYIAPIALLIMFWLNNRKPEAWSKQVKDGKDAGAEGLTGTVEIPARVPENVHGGGGVDVEG